MLSFIVQESSVAQPWSFTAFMTSRVNKIRKRDILIDCIRYLNKSQIYLIIKGRFKCLKLKKKLFKKAKIRNTDFFFLVLFRKKSDKVRFNNNQNFTILYTASEINKTKIFTYSTTYYMYLSSLKFSKTRYTLLW